MKLDTTCNLKASKGELNSISGDHVAHCMIPLHIDLLTSNTLCAKRV